MSAALKADSVPERALLRAEGGDIFALSAEVDAEISEVLCHPTRDGLSLCGVVGPSRISPDCGNASL